MKYGIKYEVLHDERHNAAIVNGNLNEYDNSRCTNIVYETSYSGGDGGYLACLYENVVITPYSSGDVKSVEQYQHFINSQGIITDYLISLDSTLSPCFAKSKTANAAANSTKCASLRCS